MAKFLPANKLCSLRSLSSDPGRTHTRKHTSYATPVGGEAGALAAGSIDGVIPQVASHHVSKSADGKENAQENRKAFWMRNPATGYWMRNPATGYWIPEDHFGEIDIAEFREKILSSGSKR